MEKKIVGIDCDEVLCLLMKDFVPYMNERFNLQLKYEDLKEYDLNKYFHLNEDKVFPYFQSLLQYWQEFVEYCKERPKYVFYLTIFYVQLELVEGAKEALKTLSTKYKLVLITGRHEVKDLFSQ